MPVIQKETPESFKQRLTPTHLLDASATEDFKEQAEAAIGEDKPKADVDPDKNPRSKNPYTFQFDWADSRGKKWVGSFTTHFPTPMDLVKAGVMQARMTGSTAKDSLDALTDEIAFMVSRLSYCLDKRPDWFKDPMSIIDGVPLIQAIYSEVVDFEQFFREHGKA